MCAVNLPCAAAPAKWTDLLWNLALLNVWGEAWAAHNCEHPREVMLSGPLEMKGWLDWCQSKESSFNCVLNRGHRCTAFNFLGFVRPPLQFSSHHEHEGVWAILSKLRKSQQQSAALMHVCVALLYLNMCTDCFVQYGWQSERLKTTYYCRHLTFETDDLICKI